MNQVYFRNHEYYRSEFPLPPDDGGREKTRKGQIFADHDNATAILLQKIIDASGASIVILDKYQTISYVNRVWRQFATRTGSMAIQFGIGSRYPEMALGVASMSASDAAIISKGIDRVIAESEVEFNFEYQSTAIAETTWFRLHAAEFRFPDEDCEPMVLVTHDDITAEKLTGDLLRKDRERLGRLLAVTKILHWEADPETGVCTYISEQAEPMLGYPKDAWLQPGFWRSHIHPDDREWTIAESSKLAQSADEYHIEYRMVSKDERIVWVNDNVSIRRENGVPTTMSGFMIDVTERKQAENTLRLLGGRLITAQEEERKRIARELHDDLNQKMALLSIELEQIGQTLKTDTVRAGERIKELQKNAFKISKDIHQMSYMLHPSKLDHLGLVPALNSFCEELSEARDFSIHFTHEG
ncbi:MAG TPA: PAS domain-containing protein, partial [Pyrinomonadaceae bacterium]|nr:PAS domain-containing protein [Pyrinomonadaceae bacterium]